MDVVSGEMADPLLSVSGLSDLLRGPRPVVVVEVSWAPLERATSYLAGHPPGAVHLDTDDLEDGYPTWKLRPFEALGLVIGGLGVHPATTVAVYSDRFIAACRAWWALLVAGVHDVRILDGGVSAWRAAGMPIETGCASASPANFRGSPRLEFVASTSDVERAIQAANVWIADVRSAEEFEGRKSGYPYLDAAGRIPSSLHLGDADDTAARYTRSDGTMRSARQIVTTWRMAGITGAPPAFDREVIFSCGSGWRSSAAFFAAWRAGYRNIRNFSDGWCGWSTAYVRDPAAAGSTPGWRQELSARVLEAASLWGQPDQSPGPGSSRPSTRRASGNATSTAPSPAAPSTLMPPSPVIRP